MELPSVSLHRHIHFAGMPNSRKATLMQFLFIPSKVVSNRRSVRCGEYLVNGYILYNVCSHTEHIYIWCNNYWDLIEKTMSKMSCYWSLNLHDHGESKGKNFCCLVQILVIRIILLLNRASLSITTVIITYVASWYKDALLLKWLLPQLQTHR